jgi:hypothetical protein
MGVSGACRCCELTNLKISDVEDRGAYLIVSIPDTKTGVSQKFTILEEGFSINTVGKCRKYMSLRPKKYEVKYDKTKNEISMNVNVNVNINNK